MGSGKTFLTLHHSLDKLENSKTLKKIVYIRNNIDVKDTNNLGALPSGLKEKLLPYIMPIADCIGNLIGLQMLENQEKIEYVHLGFVRGRSFSDSIIIVSESQSLTRDHVALLLGRVGDNSIIIFEGDLTQIDKKVFSESSGILALEEVLSGNELFGWVHLDKTERSRVANLSGLF
jgi:predicted ribonuclease YlaK